MCVLNVHMWGGGGKPQKTLQSPNRQYKAPTDYTKPRQTIQSPDRQYKAPEKTIRNPKLLDKDQHIKQIPKMFNKSSNKY